MTTKPVRDISILFLNFKFLIILIGSVIIGILIQKLFPSLTHSSPFSSPYVATQKEISSFVVMFISGFIAVLTGYFVTQILHKHAISDEQLLGVPDALKLLAMKMKLIPAFNNGNQYNSDYSESEEKIFINYLTVQPKRLYHECIERSGAGESLLWASGQKLILKYTDVDHVLKSTIMKLQDDIYLRSCGVKNINPHVIPDLLYNIYIGAIIVDVLISLVILLSIYGWYLGYICFILIYIIFIGVIETTRAYQPFISKDGLGQKELRLKLDQKEEELRGLFLN